jgi:hypothetical protein
MFDAFARLTLGRMEARYNYDTGYLRHMLKHAPRAFWKFSRLAKLSQHRESAPVEALFTVKLLGAMKEDCGPCIQLVADFAKEAKVPAGQIEAVLRRDMAAMSEPVALAYRYGQAVLSRLPEADALRQAVRARWGEKGLIDLAIGMQAGRLFPMLKDALGYARECRRVNVEGRPIEVAHEAA